MNQQNSIALYELNYRELKTYLMAALFVAGNIALPQLCHLMPQGGLIFLPIYFFTLVGAYKYGLAVYYHYINKEILKDKEQDERIAYGIDLWETSSNDFLKQNQFTKKISTERKFELREHLKRSIFESLLS